MMSATAAALEEKLQAIQAIVGRDVSVTIRVIDAVNSHRGHEETEWGVRIGAAPQFRTGPWEAVLQDVTGPWEAVLQDVQLWWETERSHLARVAAVAAALRAAGVDLRSGNERRAINDALDWIAEGRQP